MPASLNFAATKCYHSVHTPHRLGLGGSMLDSRRSFLSSFSAFGVLALLVPQAPPTIHQPINMPPKPGPGETLPAGQKKNTSKNNPAALAAHEKELRETTDQLLIKVQEFRAKLDGTHTADIFSVAMYKQTEDIEKLAKQLRNRAKP